MMRGTVEFLPDKNVNEAGEEAGWLAIAYKTGKYKHFVPWQRATAPGSAHIVGVRCTRQTDTSWALDEEDGQHWFERIVNVGTEPLKTENLKPRPAGIARTGNVADFDDYYDQDALDAEQAKEEKAEAKTEAKEEKAAVAAKAEAKEAKAEAKAEKAELQLETKGH